MQLYKVCVRLYSNCTVGALTGLWSYPGLPVACGLWGGGGDYNPAEQYLYK
jgi:hypothetical protein